VGAAASKPSTIALWSKRTAQLRRPDSGRSISSSAVSHEICCRPGFFWLAYRSSVNVPRSNFWAVVPVRGRFAAGPVVRAWAATGGKLSPVNSVSEATEPVCSVNRENAHCQLRFRSRALLLNVLPDLSISRYKHTYMYRIDTKNHANPALPATTTHSQSATSPSSLRPPYAPLPAKDAPTTSLVRRDPTATGCA
jgi:hypothetical protein